MISDFFLKYFYDKRKNFKVPILKSWIFWGVLGVKVIASFLFTSPDSLPLFAEFVSRFINSGFGNPYNFFFHAGVTNIFPYPSGMLLILSVPWLVASTLFSWWPAVLSPVHLFTLRLPLLLADIAIFLVLARWLKNKQDAVLKYYWCSPILFYISYVHGQLDAVPIALLFISLYFLFKERFYLASMFLGFAIATKVGIFIALPFIISYLVLKKMKVRQIFLLFFIPIFIFIFFNFPYLFSAGFQNLVLTTSQSVKIFDFKINFGGDFVIYLVPFAYLLLFAKSLTYKTYNRDIFLMFLGFGFGILTFFISPMQGWYFWVVPFFVYFYIKQGNAPVFSWVALNILYFLYFLFVPNSDMFQIFAPISSYIASLPNLYAIVSAHGYNAPLLVNSIFSFLQATLLLTTFWIYRKGIESNMHCKISYEPYLIGISGDSGSGKSTIALLLQDVFGSKNTALLEGDDMHKWERGNKMWKKFTHLDPRANNLHTDLEQAFKLKEGSSISRRHYDHSAGTFTLPKKFESKKIIVFEGLHSLFLSKMRDILNLKIFLKPDKHLRVHWKIIRDMRDRGHSKKMILEEEQLRAEDSDQYIGAQERYSNMVISLKSDTELAGKIGDPNVEINAHLSIQCGNHINMDPLLSALAESGRTANLNHSFSDELQMVELSGVISAVDIDFIAHSLFPELWDVVTHEPKWRNNYEGLIQLFVCYYIFEQLKFEEYEKEIAKPY